MALRATLWKYVEGTCRNWKPWTAWERGLSLGREASLDEVKEPPSWEYVKGTCQKWKPREEWHTLSVAVTSRAIEKWAAGGILRSDTGSPIFMFSILLSKSNSELAVLKAWERGLQLTRESSLDNLEKMVIETTIADNILEDEIKKPVPEGLSQILSEKTEVDKVYLYTLTRIKRLLYDIQYKEVRVIPVTANKVAIKLAEMGKNDNVTFQLFFP
ncbi:hypothetical protein ACS0TY_019116 [Phlomoides rotata]